MDYSNSVALETKYNGKITLLDAIQDPKISEMLEKFYVPEIKIYETPSRCIFIQKDGNVALTNEGPRTIRFIYMNDKGTNMTSPDSAYIQMGKECKGFLARLSISKTNFTYPALTLDYLVDVANIEYRVDTVMSVVNNPETGVAEMVSQSMIHFENIDFSRYSHLNWDPGIREFSMNKEDLFIRYFE